MAGRAVLGAFSFSLGSLSTAASRMPSELGPGQTLWVGTLASRCRCGNRGKSRTRSWELSSTYPERERETNGTHFGSGEAAVA